MGRRRSAIIGLSRPTKLFGVSSNREATQSVRAIWKKEGVGASNLTSTGDFLLQRKGDRITVTVSVTHVWSDAGYEFDPDDPFYDESQVLERHKKAKPFKWKAEWNDVITGELEILNAFSSNATRRWINFEVKPAS
jgi:hypothetical protein